MIVFKQEDAKGFLNSYADNFFSLAVDDPPYGIKEDGRKKRPHTAKQKNGRIMRVPANNYTAEGWDNSVPAADYFELLKRKSKHQLIFGANYFAPICGNTFKPPRRADYPEFVAKHPTGWIIWDKVNGDCDFNDCELIWTSLPIQSTIFYFMWAGMRQGKSIAEGHIMQGNKKLNEKRIHPTQKPVNVYKYLLHTYAGMAGGAVVDPHAGSMSIGIAAMQYGFELHACENNLKHYTDAKRRLEQYKNSNLFLNI